MEHSQGSEGHPAESVALAGSFSGVIAVLTPNLAFVTQIARVLPRGVTTFTFTSSLFEYRTQVFYFISSNGTVYVHQCIDYFKESDDCAQSSALLMVVLCCQGF